MFIEIKRGLLRPELNGAFDWIRTNDLCLRRATLYLAELRMLKLFKKALFLPQLKASKLLAFKYRVILSCKQGEIRFSCNKSS